jgi:hypothetical protein
VSRRGRQLWHWGTGKDLLSRQERRAADDLRPPRQGRPGRKDTRRWCRGVEGREHDPEIVIPENQRWRWNVCRPAQPWMRSDWSCAHAERCRACGKVMRDGWQLNHPQECPDYRPVGAH